MTNKTAAQAMASIDTAAAGTPTYARFLYSARSIAERGDLAEATELMLQHFSKGAVLLAMMREAIRHQAQHPGTDGVLARHDTRSRDGRLKTGPSGARAAWGTV